jgi:hypothetical protein
MAAVIMIPAKMSTRMAARTHSGDSTHHQDHEIPCASRSAVNTAASKTARPSGLIREEGLPAIPDAPSSVPRP